MRLPQYIGQSEIFGNTSPAGTHSVDVIAWGKREIMEHRGNLTGYFAKTVLTVK